MQKGILVQRNLITPQYEQIPTLQNFRPTLKYKAFTTQDAEDIQKFIDSLNNKKRKIRQEIEEEEESDKKRKLEQIISPEKNNFENCPNDILGVIFRFLEDLDDIRASLQVNKKWNSAIDSNEALWENLCRIRCKTCPAPKASVSYKTVLQSAVRKNLITPTLHYTVRKADLSKYGLGEKEIMKYNVRGKIKKEHRSQTYFDYSVDVMYYASEDIERAQKKKWNDWLEVELMANNISLEHKHHSHFEAWLENGSSKAKLRNLIKSFLEKNGQKNTEEEPTSKLPTVSEISKMSVKQLKATLVLYGITPEGIKVCFKEDRINAM